MMPGGTVQISPKWMSLGYFVVQNCVLIIGLRVCIEYSNPDKPYIASTVVLFTEPLKLLLSLIACFIFDAHLNWQTFLELFQTALFDEGADIIKLCVPGALYIIQNNLQYTIESAPLFMVMYQMKVITTALFYSTLLSRRISRLEWIAIFTATIGVAMVQSSQKEFHAHHASNIVGIICVLIACMTSGFAGVYFEKILKVSKTSIWMLNIELSMISCILSVITCLTEDTQVIIDNGFFSGYNIFVVLIIILQAVTGLAVALVVKYADNIHKGFANSLSIVISGLVESFIFPNSFTINRTFTFGSMFVVLATLCYVAVTNKASLLTLSITSALQLDAEKEHVEFSMRDTAQLLPLSSNKSGDKIEPWLAKSIGSFKSFCHRTTSSFYQSVYYNISTLPPHRQNQRTNGIILSKEELLENSDLEEI